MSVTLTLDIKLWRPGQQERLLTARQLRDGYDQLKEDEQLLQAMMIDNFCMVFSVDGTLISRCTCMFDGESSPDLMYLYENHLLDLWERKPVTIHFYEEMVCWRLTPHEQNKDQMKWEILDVSRGQSSPVLVREGDCERLPFINDAVNWLADALAILKQYQDITKREGHQDLSFQIDFAQRLYDYSRQTLVSHGWQLVRK